MARRIHSRYLRLSRSVFSRAFEATVNEKSALQSCSVLPRNSRKMKVLCIDPFDNSPVEEFRQRGHIVDEIHEPDTKTLQSIIANYDSAMVSKDTVFGSEVLENAKSLKIVGIPDTGLGKVDVSSLTKHGALLLNTEEKHGAKSTTEAELILSLLYSTARLVPQAAHSVKMGMKKRREFMGVELKGKHVGIIGLGRVGLSLATVCRSLGLNVIAFDKKITEEGAKAYGITKASLEQLLEKSDFITFDVPLTKQTLNLLDTKTLALCKDGVRIISVGRAGIINEKALLEALNSGKVAGAALDTFCNDPLSEDSKPLLQHPRLICTPNINDSVHEHLSRSHREIAEQMCNAWAQQEYSGVANAVFMPLALVPEMGAFLKLADLLGSLQAQITDEKISKVTIIAQGGKDIDITTPKAKALILAGVLRGLVRNLKTKNEDSPRCSLVNASILALEHGIRPCIGDPRGNLSPDPLKNKITVVVTTAKGNEKVVIGSVFGEEPRVIQLFDFQDQVAFKPEGTVLFFQNKDEPGAISRILDVLADSSINVASLVLGRKKEEGQAMGILSLDGELPSNVMSKIKEVPYVCEVRVGKFDSNYNDEFLW